MEEKAGSITKAIEDFLNDEFKPAHYAFVFLSVFVMCLVMAIFVFPVIAQGLIIIILFAVGTGMVANLCGPKAASASAIMGQFP